MWDTPARFDNRDQAGQLLAKKLTKYANRRDVLVLGIPRGGVSVAFQIAKALHAPLDILICRKLGTPGQEELALGAIASGGVRVLNADVVELLGIPEAEIERIAANEQQELERRERAYRGERPPLEIRNRTVIIVDDGIATGSNMTAAIRALRQMKPARIVVAVPVAPFWTCESLKKEADEVVSLEIPQSFQAIGQFYLDFSEVTDAQVYELLQRAVHPSVQVVP
jgi:putative phosphoribosyl transferase